MSDKALWVAADTSSAADADALEASRIAKQIEDEAFASCESSLSSIDKMLTDLKAGLSGDGSTAYKNNLPRRTSTSSGNSTSGSSTSASALPPVVVVQSLPPVTEYISINFDPTPTPAAPPAAIIAPSDIPDLNALIAGFDAVREKMDAGHQKLVTAISTSPTPAPPKAVVPTAKPALNAHHRTTMSFDELDAALVASSRRAKFDRAASDSEASALLQSVNAVTSSKAESLVSSALAASSSNSSATARNAPGPKPGTARMSTFLAESLLSLDSDVSKLSFDELKLSIVHCERQIDIETRIQHGIESLISLTSEIDSPEVAQQEHIAKLIDCHKRLAKLRSRLSQCLVQQLIHLADGVGSKKQQSIAPLPQPALPTVEVPLRSVSVPTPPSSVAEVVLPRATVSPSVATSLNSNRSSVEPDALLSTSSEEASPFDSALSFISSVEKSTPAVVVDDNEPAIDFESSEITELSISATGDSAALALRAGQEEEREREQEREKQRLVEQEREKQRILELERKHRQEQEEKAKREAHQRQEHERQAQEREALEKRRLASASASASASVSTASSSSSSSSTASVSTASSSTAAAASVSTASSSSSAAAPPSAGDIDMDAMVAAFVAEDIKFDNGTTTPSPTPTTSASSSTPSKRASVAALVSTYSASSVPPTQEPLPSTAASLVGPAKEEIVRPSVSINSLKAVFSKEPPAASSQSPSVRRPSAATGGQPQQSPAPTAAPASKIPTPAAAAAAAAAAQAKPVAPQGKLDKRKSRSVDSLVGGPSPSSSTRVSVAGPTSPPISSRNATSHPSLAEAADQQQPSAESEKERSRKASVFEEPHITLSIPRALIVDGGTSKMHNVFEIVVHTNLSFFLKPLSTVQRRYSEFEWLYTKLLANHGALPLELPGKKTIGKFDPVFVEERRSKLEAFLRVIVSNPLYQRDKTLLLWLQTDQSISAMMTQLSFNSNEEDAALSSAVSDMEKGVADETERQKLEDQSSDFDVLSKLSVTRLKRILTMEKLSADGCFEKKDLVERIWKHRNRTVDAKYTGPMAASDSAGGGKKPGKKGKNSDGDEDVETKWSQIANWDATRLLHNIYTDVRPRIIKKQDPKKPLKAGWLEKQARGQSKISFGKVFKSWKKRWFTLMDGSLLYFEDEKCTRSLGFLRVRGGKCIARGGGLEIFDAAGRNMLLRPATDQFTPEIEDAKLLREWQVAIEKQLVASASSQRTEDDDYDKAAIVIDNGSADVKAGFAVRQPLEAWPNAYFPTIVGVNKDSNGANFVGLEALRPKNRPFCTLVSPLNPKASYHFENMEEIWLDAYTQLGVNPIEHAVVMSAPQFATLENKKAMAEIMFEKLNVPCLYIQHQAVLSMYSYSQITGISVDIGDRVDVVPIDQGYIVRQGVAQLQYGGKDVTTYFGRLMSESGYRFFSGIESSINRYIKEKIGYVSLDYSADVATASEFHEFTVGDDAAKSATDGSGGAPAASGPAKKVSPFEATVNLDRFNLPDGTQSVTIGSARFRCTEGLFNPLLFGKDNPGVHHLVAKAVSAVSLDMRRTMCRNIYLSGGSTMFPGFQQRLESELKKLLPNLASHIQVHAHENRKFAAFLGGCTVANLDTFDQMCIWNDDYEERGFDSIVATNSSWQ